MSATGRDWPRRLAQGFDLARIRCDGEIELRDELQKTSAGSRLLKEWSDPRLPPTGVPKGLLYQGARASLATVPSVVHVAELVRRVLRLSMNLEIRIIPTDIPGCWLFPEETKEVIRVGMSSSLATLLRVREAAFIVARTAAGRLLGHVPLLADPAAASVFPDRVSQLARGLWRFQQMSADRIGLLVCQDAEVACQAIYKQIVGLNEPMLRFRLAPFLAGTTPREEALLAEDEEEYLVYRFASLVRFEQSDDFQTGISIAAQSMAPPKSETKPSESALAEPPKLVRMVRPMADHPDLMEEVFVAAPSTLDPESVANRIPAIEAIPMPSPSEWTERARADLIEDSLGWLEFEEPAGTHIESTAHSIRKLDLDDRRDVFREILSCLSLHGEQAPLRKRIALLGDWLGLTPDDVEVIRSEFFDSDFALYTYRVGQDVEVLLDGIWHLGTVEALESAGELRVRLGTESTTYRFSPQADLIRPTVSVMGARQAS